MHACGAASGKPGEEIAAWSSVDEASFQEIVYDAGDWDAQRRTPSDHCPIVVTLNWPAAD